MNDAISPQQAADRAALRMEAAIQRHTGWQLEYDFAMVVNDRKRLIDELAQARARVAELELVPRCGATTPSAFINAEPLGPCILNHGHSGMHQEASTGIPPIPGARWTEHNDPLAVARAHNAELAARVAELEGKWNAIRSWTRSRLQNLDSAQRDWRQSSENAAKQAVLGDLSRCLEHLTEPQPAAAPDRSDGNGH